MDRAVQLQQRRSGSASRRDRITRGIRGLLHGVVGADWGAATAGCGHLAKGSCRTSGTGAGSAIRRGGWRGPLRCCWRGRGTPGEFTIDWTTALRDDPALRLSHSATGRARLRWARPGACPRSRALSRRVRGVESAKEGVEVLREGCMCQRLAGSSGEGSMGGWSARSDDAGHRPIPQPAGGGSRANSRGLRQWNGLLIARQPRCLQVPETGRAAPVELRVPHPDPGRTAPKTPFGGPSPLPKPRQPPKLLSMSRSHE